MQCKYNNILVRSEPIVSRPLRDTVPESFVKYTAATGLFSNMLNTRDLHRTSTLVLSSAHNTWTRTFIDSMVKVCVAPDATCILEYTGVEADRGMLYRRLGKAGGHLLMVGIDNVWNVSAINDFVRTLPNLRHLVLMMSSQHYSVMGVPSLERHDIQDTFVCSGSVMSGPVKDENYVAGIKAAFRVPFTMEDPSDHIVNSTMKRLKEQCHGKDAMFGLGLYTMQGALFKLEAYHRDQLGLGDFSFDNSIYANYYVQESTEEQNDFDKYYTLLQGQYNGEKYDLAKDLYDMFGTTLAVKASYTFRKNRVSYVFTPDFWKNTKVLEMFY